MNAVGNAVSNAVGNGGRVCGLYLLFGGLPSCFGHAGRACEASPGAACVRAMCANRSPAATEAVALFDVEHGTTPQRACGDAGMAVARRDARPWVARVAVSECGHIRRGKGGCALDLA